MTFSVQLSLLKYTRSCTTSDVKLCVVSKLPTCRASREVLRHIAVTFCQKMGDIIHLTAKDGGGLGEGD